MSHSHQKNSGPPSAFRMPASRTHGGSSSASSSRSNSHKKNSSSVDSGSQSGSRKKKAARAWDDSIHDLSVHRLPKQKQMEKQMNRLSRQQLGKIAALPLPTHKHAAVVHAIEALSPTHVVQRPRANSNSSRRSSSQTRGRSRSRSPASFASPQHAGEWEESSAASTPDSRSSADEHSSVSSTPSPSDQRARPQQAQHRAPPQMLTVKPQVPRQTRPVKKELPQQVQQQAQPAQPAHSSLTRLMAAPVVTSAPPSQENSDDEDGDNSFSAFAPPAGSTSTATLANYSPWLKPNHMLSPVLERSIIDSAASTPSGQTSHQQQQSHQPQLRSLQEEESSPHRSQAEQAQSQGLDRPFFTESDSTAPSVTHSPARFNEQRHAQQQHQQSEEQHGSSSRNLLHELHQSLDQRPRQSNMQPAAVQQQQQQPQVQSATLSSMPLPSLQHFMSLMSTVAAHLNEREAVAAQEAQFKSSTVASLSGCNAQLKSLTARLDEAERENRAMKAAALQQHLEYEKSMHAMQQQMRALEQRLEQMAMGAQAQAQANPAAPVNGPTPVPTHAYNPSLYHSQHHNRSAMPTPSLPHTSVSFSSSNYNMQSAMQSQQQPPQATSRAPSPPRAIVINHSTNSAVMAAPARGYAAQQALQMMQQQPQSQPQPQHLSKQAPPAFSHAPSSYGSRLSEIDLHVADGFRPTSVHAAMGARGNAPAQAAPSHRVAWQAAKPAHAQQPQPHSQMRPRTATDPGAALRQPTAHLQQHQQQLQQQHQQQQQHLSPSSRFSSTLVDPAGDFDDLDDEAPRQMSAASLAPPAAGDRFAPFSPGSEQDEEEARQFAQQAARMRAQMGAMHGQKHQHGQHAQQQTHSQQPQQPRSNAQ